MILLNTYYIMDLRKISFRPTDEEIDYLTRLAQIYELTPLPK
jgi:hypothetical protein